MKKGFTLVEMLIVVVVLVTLMTITFRLSSTGSDQSRRASTISRMQRLENCLSGYYAAYGSYPPVALYAKRDWRLKLDETSGDQTENEINENIWGWDPLKFKSWVDSGFKGWKGGDKDEEENAWKQVRMACKAQPLDCRFPFRNNGGADYVTAVLQASYEYHKEKGDVSEAQLSKLQRGADSGTANVGRFSSKKDSSDWREIKLFKYGVMSYLLPRLSVMMRGNEAFFTEGFAQWDDNNPQPTDPLRGSDKLEWKKLYEWNNPSDGKPEPMDLATLAMIPSQAVCARWLPNLEKCCSGNAGCELSGIQVIDPDGDRFLSVYTKYPEIYVANGQPYCLDGISMKDGWGSEFLYYSPAPYQTYTLWSAGRNERTFPVWVDRGSLGQKANQCIAAWCEDDIMHMSN